jgi:hypothetical protein
MNKLVSAVILSLALAGCGGGKIILHMQGPVASADIHVTPTELMINGKKLWVKLQVQNAGPGTLLLQRDQIVVHLPNGQTLTRAIGTYGGGWGYGYGAGYASHEPYVIPSGAIHPVYVEFEEQGFKWKEMPSAQIDFAGAITRDGQPVTIPPFVVSQ